MVRTQNTLKHKWCKLGANRFPSHGQRSRGRLVKDVNPQQTSGFKFQVQRRDLPVKPSSANRGTIMTHYDSFNILYPLWHYYDTIIAIITFTKVGPLLHIMTKSGKTLLFHLWQFYYCHYNFSILLLQLLLLWHYYGHYGYLKNLWHSWQSGFIIVSISMGNYYLQ